jgi:hypothetical protein
VQDNEADPKKRAFTKKELHAFFAHCDLCRTRHKSAYVEYRIMPSAVVKVLVSGG